MAENSEIGINGIPKLNRKNWNAWKARVKTELLAKEAWEAVQGYAEKEGGTSLAESRRRNKANLTAMAVIMRTVGDELINDITDFEAAKEAWDHLEKVCCENTDYGAATKFRELASFRKTPEMSIQSYCNTVMDMNRSLARNDLSLNDKQLAAVCLTGLPKEMRSQLRHSFPRKIT